MNKEWPSFDELKKLAEHSPDRLEEFRMREIEAIISQAPERLKRRLHGIQFQINCEMRRHKTPLASCIAISRMMHESVTRLNATLNGKPEERSFNKVRTDNVLPFVG